MAKARKRTINIPLRLLLIGLAILLQLMLFFGMVFLLSSHQVLIYTFLHLISFAVVVGVINRQGNPSYKITWIVIIMMFPLFGGLLYLMWGGNRVSPRKKKLLYKIQDESRQFLGNGERQRKILAENDIRFLRQSDFLLRESGHPLYSGNETSYFAPVETAMTAICSELQKAEKYIFIEFFILAQGKMWNQIHDIISYKARHGVDVRIMFDDFGSASRQYKGFVQSLKADGIKVAVFNPLKPSPDLFMNNRNHRKLIVIDGKTAFTGGFNIGDEYINEWKRHGYWHDSVIRVKGDAAWSFAVMFLNIWQFVTKQSCDYQSFIPEKQALSGIGLVQPYSDEPLDSSIPAKGIYLQMINDAQRYLFITTPYLIIDNEIITALSLASKSGVDVRIVTPHIPDKFYVHPVTQCNYEPLLEAGIRIYEYTPGFMHSKLFVADDKVATVGTVNMDYRSFYFHFECGVWMYDTHAVSEIVEEMYKIFSVSQEIELAKWKKRPKLLVLKQALLYVISPFL